MNGNPYVAPKLVELGTVVEKTLGEKVVCFEHRGNIGGPE